MSLKDFAIYKLNVVGGAVDQLEQAIASLEHALDVNPDATLGGGEEQRKVIQETENKLAEITSENAALKDTTRDVSARLDGAIHRIQSLLGD